MVRGAGAAEGWREKRAGCLAGRVGGGPCIDSQPLSSSLSPPCHGSREREREGGGNDRGRKDRSQPLNIGVEHLDVAMSEITVEHVGIGGLV